MNALSVTSDALPKGPGKRILRKAEAEAWQSGFNFCQEARRYAEQVKEQARLAYEAEKARGFGEGRDEGAREATRLLGETTVAVDRYLASLQGDVGRLALTIVRRLLGELDAADLIGRLAASAIAEFRREKWLKIRVHPTLVEPARAAMARASGPPGCTLTVEADARLDKQACVVASEFAVVDASIDAQLKAIFVAFGISEEVAAP
jgi:type III secretion protein L